MPERVGWLSPIDIYILQFFKEHDIRLTPKVLAENLGYDQDYTGKRCRVLTEEGLLNQEKRGVYSLTEKGREFVESGLNPDVLS